MKTTPNIPRAQLGAIVREIQDIQGNKDGIWGNEGRPAGTVGDAFDRNPISLGIQSFSSVGASARDERRMVEEFRRAAEEKWGMPVMDPAIEAAHPQGFAFAAIKTAQLERLGRTPAEVTETFLTAKGRVAGEDIPEARLFVQRFRPIGEPTGDVVLLSPGFLETGRVFTEQVDRLTRAGLDVLVLDHQWGGLSDGKKGGIASGESIALHTARAAAYAAEIAETEYGDKGRAFIMGESMGAGPGALGLSVMTAAGQIELEGAKLPRGLDIVLQDPFLGATPNIPNRLFSQAASLPLLNKVALPAIGLPKLADDRIAQHKFAQGAVLEDVRAQLSAFTGANGFIEKIKAAIEAGQRPDGRVIIIHDDRDPLADPAMSRWLSEKLGPDAKLVRLDGGNHILAASNPEVGAQELIELAKARRAES